MAISRITELGLESQAKELKSQNKTNQDIANILSQRANVQISRLSVSRFFSAESRQHRDLIEKKENLQAKVIEVELDTIGRRNKIVERLERIADKAEEEGISKTVIEALKTQIAALDSLDKRLGRFTENKNEQTVINIIVSNQVDV